MTVVVRCSLWSLHWYKHETLHVIFWCLRIAALVLFAISSFEAVRLYLVWREGRNQTVRFRPAYDKVPLIAALATPFVLIAFEYLLKWK